MERLDLRTTERNTTVPNLVFGVQINGADPVSAIASVAIRLHKNGKLEKTYSGSDFTVTPASFTLNQHIMDLRTFPYIYDCVITFANDVVKSYFGGYWVVTEAGKTLPKAKNYSPINQALSISGSVSETGTSANIADDVTITVNDAGDNVTITVSTGDAGLPSGGTTGQALTKASDDDGDVEWSTPAGGGDLLASANLLDLDDVAIARQNLGVDVPKQAKFNFSYGDVTTQTIYTAIAGQRITEVKVGFDTAFNVASTLQVGDGANIQRLMDTGQNDPTSTDAFFTAPFYRYTAETDIILTLNAGVGATQGSGTVILYFE